MSVKDEHRQAVLLVLINHRDDDNGGWMYTLDILKELEGSSLGVEYIYAVHARLEREELVESRWDPNESRGGLHRRQYRVKPDKVHDLLRELEGQTQERSRKTPARRTQPLLRPRPAAA